jgi:hypothetical protein
VIVTERLANAAILNFINDKIIIWQRAKLAYGPGPGALTRTSRTGGRVGVYDKHIHNEKELILASAGVFFFVILWRALYNLTCD